MLEGLRGRVAFSGLTVAILAAAIVGCSPAGSENPRSSSFEIQPAPVAAPAVPRVVTDAAEYEALKARLTRDGWFGQTAADFLGPLRGEYVTGRTNPLVADEVNEALSGAPIKIEVLPNGGYLAWNCRHRSCGDRAALHFSAEGRLVGVGLLHGGCTNGCQDHVMLLTQFRRTPLALGEPNALEQWAERQRHAYENPPQRMMLGETVLVQ